MPRTACARRRGGWRGCDFSLPRGHRGGIIADVSPRGAPCEPIWAVPKDGVEKTPVAATER